MDGVYEILNYMTGDNLYTHQIPRAIEECQPFLLKQFPDLKNVIADDVTCDNIDEWIKDKAKRFGEYKDVEPLPVGVHKYIDPIVELEEMKRSY
jgi:hypothetical protein